MNEALKSRIENQTVMKAAPSHHRNSIASKCLVQHLVFNDASVRPCSA